MKFFLVIFAFFGIVYSGVIEHNHEHQDGAKSYQHVNIDNYHAVPVYIKHTDKELLKHRIGGVQHNVKVSHGHGKHDSGHAIITSAVEGHGHEGHGNHESTLIGKHVLSEAGHNFGIGNGHENQHAHIGGHEGLSLGGGHEGLSLGGGHEAHLAQLGGHESLGGGHEEASQGAAGHEGLGASHGGLSLGGGHGGFGGGHEGFVFKGHEALSLGGHEGYGGHENSEAGSSGHESGASYGVHETSGGDEGGHQQSGYGLSHLGHH